MAVEERAILSFVTITKHTWLSVLIMKRGLSWLVILIQV